LQRFVKILTGSARVLVKFLTRSARATAIHNLFTIIFEKPIDKSVRIWYNIDTKRTRERECGWQVEYDLPTLKGERKMSTLFLIIALILMTIAAGHH
jgi:hypothetical protein